MTIKETIKEKEEIVLSIQDAIDNLSTIVEMELDPRTPIGIIKKHKFVLQAEEVSYKTIEWLVPENAAEILEHIRETYKTILRYLQGIYEKDLVEWDSEESKKGIRAIMVMAGEAASKLDKYLSFFKTEKGVEKVSECAELKELREFYTTKFAEKFGYTLEGDKAWREEWAENEEAVSLDLDRRGLFDFETVKKDREYELFYIRDEDERSFFTPELIRDIKLFCDFEEASLPSKDTPLVKIRGLKDKDIQAAALQILKSMEKEFERFYKERLFFKTEDIGKVLNKAMMALMLAATSKNLYKKKSCFNYFEDFKRFLKILLKGEEYQKLVAYLPEDKTMLPLVHKLCRLFFFRSSGIREEMIGFIHHLIRRGEEKRKGEFAKTNDLTIWNHLEEDDESMRGLLTFYPNFSLLKVLEAVRIEEFSSFSPIDQGNFPSLIYEMGVLGKKLHVLSMACPTSQEIISKAKVILEFEGFLRSLELNEKHLLINLQDRTSEKEYARCREIEEFPQNVEFSSKLDVITITKDTPFYHQTKEFLSMEAAKSFMRNFAKGLGEDKLGYFFVPKLKTKVFDQTLFNLLEMVHTLFFESKERLTQKERLDFIEIFYNFLILKVIEIIQPTSLSFSCKDSVDVGACHSASFYSFLKSLIQTSLRREDVDTLRWLFYAPALMVRERMVDAQAFMRIISAISYFDREMEKNRQKIVKGLQKIYNPSFFQSLEIV